ncbi:MAG TPA: sulfurtransferase [Verrucomicrobiae bacterium]|nr:sulfurtransferase [Verrucomicrobiae bacterium]
MRRFIFISLPALLLVVILAPIALAQNGPQRLRPEMLVSTDWLASHLHDPELVVLSVSSGSDFYSHGHIPGARYIALGDIAVTRNGVPNELPSVDQLQRIFAAAGMTNTSRVVLYGERYGLFAARAYFTLDYLGLADRAALLNGGLEKWKAEHRELSTDIPVVVPGRLKVALKPSILVETGAMRDLAQNKSSKVAILDARPPDEFSGARLSEDVPKAGHIPRAAGLYWMEMLVSRENPVLRPEAELRQMYANAGAGPDGALVTYCRTGMQSSFDYFVAKYLGHDASMYDASFYEWSRQDLPVEASAAHK